MTRAPVFRCLTLIVCFTASLHAAEVKINPAVTHQTVLGWSVNPWQPWMTAWQRDRLLDEAVNELGLTRIRYGPQNGNRAAVTEWEPVNDDGDPEHINWNAFGTAEVDKYVAMWIKPFKERVEANGEKFELWISPSFFNGGSTGRVPEWLYRSPGEYAEYATAFLLYLRDKHGIEADHYVICNEPANNNLFQPWVVGRMIRTLGPQMKKLGLKTTIQFPDGVSAQTTWRFIQALKNDDEVWPYITHLSYHLYGRNNERTLIRDFAKARGIPTGQTEYMSQTTEVLYDDMTLADASYWSIYGWGRVLGVNHDGASFKREQCYWNFRQVMHYVRPGAVRVDAASDDDSLRALAFTHEGRLTVVLFNNRRNSKKQDVTISGLPAGRYGICQTVNRRPYQERGVATVGADGKLALPAVKGSVVTVYPHPGGNLPPTVTGFDARPTFLTAPANRVLLVASGTDPETDPVAFKWSLDSAPVGAKVTFVKGDAATTPAIGLSAPGDYIFNLTVSDPTHKVTRQVKVPVFATNRPPWIGDVHNRIPIDVTLPHSETLLRAWAIDLEKDKWTFKWKVMKQPAGADVKLELPQMKRGRKPGAARRLTGMTVAGDYVFRFEVNDGKNVAFKEHTITVHPENHAPKITEATARVHGPGAATLSAKATDADGDVMTWWWELRRGPKGVKPVFNHPGHQATNVTGLNVAGDYVFIVTVVDRTRVSRRDVRLTLAP